MTLLGLDWNATRVRAVVGPARDYPLPTSLDAPHAELALACDLQQVKPELGAAALGVSRVRPRTICQGFLPYLTAEAGHGPRWQAGRNELDARSACEMVWRRLQPLASSARGVFVVTPGYFQPAQADTLRRMGELIKLPILGSLPTPLAIALAGHLEQFWSRSTLVLDVDEGALTLGWVKALDDRAHLLTCRSFSHLGLRFWRDRLINMLSDLFVFQHRRDPRDVPGAEQSLFDQLEVLADASLQRRAIQLGVQGQQWFKHLLVHPEQTSQFCQVLVNKAVAEVDDLMMTCPTGESPRGILLTHEAGRLPGLVEALRSLVKPTFASEPRRVVGGGSGFHGDFGDELLFHEDEPRGVWVLPPEALARSAHSLAESALQDVIQRGHLETIVPISVPLAADIGPPRLHFQGRDILLREANFNIGTQFGCQLWLDRADHPDVDAVHCEIVYDRRVYTMYNHSRDCTLVNDHPVTGSVLLHAGDRIRLGPRGPQARFLGKTLPRPVHAVFG
ncbi:MAG: FHA domain-containing protein [Gemmataceae bacterium]|nr:FHA domain-containing protein [Gemmataceae bacterium]